MSFHNNLQQIDELQSAIRGYGQLSADLLNKINYKLRLEWNYTSNNMEGNSLTKRETRTVMVGIIDVSDKPLKDVIEMKNHDQVINTIMKMGQGELNISETRIKDIHKGIMYEENPENQAYIGRWKNVDNYMYNYRGERFDFVSHAEVPERMHQLVNWINDEKEKIQRLALNAVHPVILALKFHVDYLTIHPFYDGNGRTARILTNLILISYGFPPLYIKEDEKKRYYQYLTDIQSDGGEPDLFYEFMSGLVIRSMQIVVDTIERKETEEEDDYLKEINLLKAKFSANGKPKSPKVLYNTYWMIETEVWDRIEKVLKNFTKLFNEYSIVKSLNNELPAKKSFTALGDVVNIELAKRKILGKDVYADDIRSAKWEYTLVGLNNPKKPTNFRIILYANFEPYKVTLTLTGTDTMERRSSNIFSADMGYETSLFSEEKASLIVALKKYLVGEIKSIDEMG